MARTSSGGDAVVGEIHLIYDIGERKGRKLELGFGERGRNGHGCSDCRLRIASCVLTLVFFPRERERERV